MSKDIRSFFICKNASSYKKSESEEKPRKKVKRIVESDDEDRKEISPKGKNSKVEYHKKSKHANDKVRKRTISSDEDETEVTNIVKNKKAKLSDNGNNSNQEEKLIEITDPMELLNSKTVKKINASKIKKKIKGCPKNDKIDFMDDDFDATLNQLDTSQIEDEYRATLNKATSSYYSKEQQCHSEDENKSKEVEKKKKIHSPGSKNKTKDHSHKKNDHEKDNRKKPISHPKLEVEKGTNSPKKSKSKDIDTNDIIQEKIDKKKQHAMLYQNYLQRGGARNPGSKEIPQAAENCLADLSFLVTGVLESLEREEIEGIIKQYGGKIVHSVSKKLSYMIVGQEPGPSKMAKAESFGVTLISEDEFLELLSSKPTGKISTDSDINHKHKKNISIGSHHKSSEIVKHSKEISSENNSSETSRDEVSHKKIEKKSSFIDKNNETKHNIESKVEKITSPIRDDTNKSVESQTKKTVNRLDDDIDHLTALVEKYRPKDMKQIIGQTGDKSNAKKLYNWLNNWYKNHDKNSKASKPKFSYKDDTGAIYKAALLSGPPGIGKTTTAYVVCSQLGYEVIEFNASDTRSKRLLQEEIAGILSNKTIKSFVTGTPNDKKTTPKHILLMDEVDGMAGNEDRGGMQELITFIKSTDIPIICICNDRQSQKIKTLANYTFDLRFQKPRLEQIRAAMMSLCFKEDIKVTSDELTQIIQSTNQDIRQVVNHIAMLSAKSKSGDKVKLESKEKTQFKNVKLGAWDVVRKVFSAEEHKYMNIHDKSDLFFHDYNIAPLFVEENYVFVTPTGPRTELQKKVAKCSDSLAIGDIIESNIRGNQAWSLLPVQAIFSSVIPGSIMSGFINSQINFPSWLGRNSKTNKCERLLQDITVHARITTGASKEAINLDYLKMLVDSIMRPLALENIEGVEKAINVMNQYHLTREDLDSLVELTKWPHTRDPWQSIDTKTKTAFTKAYNKTALFSSAGTMKKKSTRDNDEDLMNDENQSTIADEEDEDDDKIENDKLIKAKASKSKNSAPAEGKGKTKKNTKNVTKNTRTKK